MNKKVVRLYPGGGESVPLRGLYLRQDQPVLGNIKGNSSLPYIYANFLTSLDGRIALREASEDYYQLPGLLKSDEDFMLFLELYARADCIITHAGYMRALNAGRLGNVLQLPESSDTQYMHDWRQLQGLKKNPDVVILSGSLDFPWHSSLDSSEQKVHIVTGGNATQINKQRWLDSGKQVHEMGAHQHVNVQLLLEYLIQQGYQSVYLVAGPDLLQDLIEHDYVHSLYMTMSHQLIGGNDFKSLLSGEALNASGRMRLENMYMDAENSNAMGQWYIEFSFEKNN
ncbi:MAG: dihydrofolate reductase family protein [Gammaproteobacteria bacterium]|nr:dihydrofolate reductase family protein [Gammaproteobacteria bacterium]